MSSQFSAFAPLPTQTVTLTAGVASSTVALSAAASAAANAGAAPQYQVYNAGTVPAFVTSGNTAVTALVPVGATPGDFCVAPGLTVVVTLATLEAVNFATTPAIYIAAVTASGTAVLYISPGTGL